MNTLGSDSQLGGDSVAASKSRHSRTVAEWLWPFLTQGVALFSISALFYCHFHRTEIVPGSLLQHAVTGLYDVFGLAPSVVFFLMVFAWSSIWLFTGILEKPAVRIGKLLVMALMLGVFFNLGSGGVAADTHTGSLGAWIASRLVVGIGYVPSIILVWPTMFASVMLATDWFFTEWFERDRRTTNFEAGVEDAVTDHLRGLSSIANKPQLDEPEPVRPAALGAATPAAVTIEVVERAAVTDAPVEEIVEPVAVESVAEVPSVAPLAVRGARYTEEDDGSESDVTGEAAVVKPTRALSYAERRRLRAERRSTEEVGGPAPVASPTEPVEAAAIPAKGSGRPLVGKTELEALFGADDDAAVVDSEAIGAEIPGAEDRGAEANGLMSVEHEVAEEVLAVAPSPQAQLADAASEEVEDDSAEVDAEEAEVDEEHEDEDEYEDEDELEGEETEGEEEAEEGEEEEYEEEEEGDELEEEYEEEEESGEAEYEFEEEDGEVDAEYEEEGLEDEELEEEADDEVEDVAHAEAEVVVDNGVAWHDVSAESVAEPSEIAASEVEVREAEAAAAALEDASEATEVAAASEADGSIVSIPRPDQVAPVSLPTPPAVVGERETAASKQQKLFASRVDEDLLLEAMDLVSRGRRTTATLLQRKLRIDYELAVEVLEELMNRGLLAGDEDRS